MTDPNPMPMRVAVATLACLTVFANACRPSGSSERAANPDSTVAVLMKASVPLVTGGVRYGTLSADSLLVLDEATRFTGFAVQLVLAEGPDTVTVRASEGRMRLGSGAVDLVGLQFRTQSGRQVSGDAGRFDGRNSIAVTSGMRIDGRAVAPQQSAVTYRIGTGKLNGCGTECS